MNTLRAAWLVALKDLQLELRTKEILTSTGLFAVLVVTLGSLAFYTDPVSSPDVAPGVLWISILFCGILLIGRSWALERENDAVFGLLLAPIPRASIYVGKTISALVLLVIDSASRSGSNRKPSSARHGTNTGVPPASRTCSGYVTQYGDGTITSSPGWITVMHAKYRLALAPGETRIWPAL